MAMFLNKILCKLLLYKRKWGGVLARRVYTEPAMHEYVHMNEYTKISKASLLYRLLSTRICVVFIDMSIHAS